MGITFSALLRGLAAAMLALSVGACAAHGITTPSSLVRAGLVQVDVYARANGSALPIHTKDGRRYIVGTPGHEYAVRIRNCTGARVLVVTSVDGVNVISGDTAAPSQSGYVLDPWSSVEIIGWRKNLERTAAFFFTEHQNSYAARTGRPMNVGVIGVAVFREKVRMTRRDQDYRRGQVASETESAPTHAPEAGASAPAPAAAPRQLDSSADSARQESMEQAPRASAKLGTGHGRNEASRVTLVNFERASETPAETVAIQYDRRENLLAMGVLPSPRITRREPEPFPGAIRFVPDPR